MKGNIENFSKIDNEFLAGKGYTKHNGQIAAIYCNGKYQKRRDFKMNEVLNNIYTRRSIRKFTEKDVPKELVDEIVKAGTFAPSGKNMQTYRFFIMQKQESGGCKRCRGWFLRIGKHDACRAFSRTWELLD